MVAYPAGVRVLISLAAQRGHKEYAVVQGKQSAGLDPVARRKQSLVLL